jgi:predicted AlkP superfamily phosphohydrolase/phosphomutase
MLGISGLNPDLVQHFLDGLPVLKLMREKGAWGKIESTLPPGSFPAWTSALSGRNIGAFGAWGSHCRDGHSYALNKEVSSELIDSRIRPLYRVLSKLGQRIGAINLPWTEPVPEISGGFCVGSGSADESSGLSTWPREFAGEVRNVVGEYLQAIQVFDKKRSRIDKNALHTELKKVDEQRFSLVKYLVQEKLCDMVMAVIEGTEAASHLFFRDADSGHALHDPKSKDREVLGDYYRFIDQQVGEILNILDDDTVICLFSVSSVQRLDGILNLNEWLIQKGYLKLKEYPKGPIPLEEAHVDWPHTKAWAMGETGQVYINLMGREKVGAVGLEEHGKVLDQLSRDLGDIATVKGKPVPAEAFRGDDLYFGSFVEYGPDVLLHIDGGRWRTDQRVGFGRAEIINTEGVKDETREGLGRSGYMCMSGSDFPAAGEVKPVSVLDIAPTIIDIMNLRAPYNTIDYEMEGYSLLRAIGDSLKEEKPGESGEKEAEEDKVRSRLEALGY